MDPSFALAERLIELDAGNPAARVALAVRPSSKTLDEAALTNLRRDRPRRPRLADRRPDEAPGSNTATARSMRPSPPSPASRAGVVRDFQGLPHRAHPRRRRPQRRGGRSHQAGLQERHDGAAHRRWLCPHHGPRRQPRRGDQGAGRVRRAGTRSILSCASFSTDQSRARRLAPTATTTDGRRGRAALRPRVGDRLSKTGPTCRRRI